MTAKTIVITGATSGIGEVAAIRLAEQGARIVAVARDSERAETTLRKLRAANPRADHVAHIADLSRLSEMNRVAREIAETEPGIDVLIDNAGALFDRRQVTEDGLEMTFALNHMSYFVLTNRLLPHLGRGTRIVVTASGAHRGAALDFDDLQSARKYVGFPVYSRSKLCNILFTRELARRLKGSGVTANCLHPGFVATRFGDNNRTMMRLGIGVAKKVGAISPEEGAKTIIYLASAPEISLVSGEYFYQCRPDIPSKEARNDADAKRLWEISAEISGVG